MLWQMYLCFWMAGILAAVWTVPVLFCALLLPVVDKRLRRVARLALAAALALAGYLLASWQLYAPQTAALPENSRRSARVCGLVRDVQDMPNNRLRIFMEQTVADDAALPGITAWTWESPLFRPLPGQTACVSQRPRPIHGFANEGMANGSLPQAARGITYSVWSLDERGNPHVSGSADASALYRENLREKFLHVLVPAGETVSQSRGILLALLFGDRRHINQQTVNNFAAATLAHSLALSGQHLAVAGLLGLICVLTAVRLRPGIYLNRPRAVWIALATCPPAVLYLWIGNAPASLLRASCMLFALAFWISRRQARTVLDGLCAALFCISVVSPLTMLDTGLQLSALSVAAIGIAMPFLRRIPPLPESTRRGATNCLYGIVRGMLQIFLLSLIIQTALLPVNLLMFGNTGFWFPLNIIWLPVVGFLALPGAALGLVLAALDMEVAARAVLNMAALPCQWLTDMLAWLDGLGILQNPAVLRPHWTTLPAYAAVFTALALTVNRPAMPQAGKRLLAIGVILLCVGPLLRAASRASDDIRLSALDVGQGQAVILRFPDNLRLLLDGGGSISPNFDPGKALVAPTLTYNDAPVLAAVGNSHPDTDHLKGLVHLLKNFHVPVLFDNGREGKGELGQRWKELRETLRSRALAEGDMLIIGKPEWGLRLEALHPPRGKQDDWQGNDASLVLRLTRNGEGLAILAGDAGVRVLRRLLHSGRDLRAQALLAPHHGSDKSFLPEFVEAVRPGVIMSSCGFRNRYGFPGKNLTLWAVARDIPLLNTGDSGQITVSWPKNAPMRVTTAITAP
ncbi:MAG: ComEC/Rec2 family competence protein [Desulfovibrio sp.]|nr:ComEC/Rec2 family competence protein [Desulfovibrio sp.]